MRVLHVITRLIMGGAQLNTLHTAARHRERGVDAEILYGPGDSERDGDLGAAAELLGVRLHQLPQLRREPSLLHDTHALLALHRFLRRNRFDIVHTHTSKAGFLGRLAGHLAGDTTVVHTPHGHVFHSYYGPVLTSLYVLAERCSANWAARMVALTQQERSEHLVLGIGDATRFVVVPSGIDVARFHTGASARGEARARLGLDDDSPVIGSVGRLAEVKGQDVLLRALPAVVRAWPGVVTVLVGDGPERQRLHKLATMLGLENRVQMLGRSDRPETLYPAFDCLAVPSRNEGMGRVVLEGMASGLPVVASGVGGILDLVRHEQNGLLVPAGDSAALAAALIRVLGDGSLRRRLGTEARATVTHDFSEQAMADQLLLLYQNVLRDRSRAT